MRVLRWSSLWIYGLIIIVPVIFVIETSFKTIATLYENPLWPAHGLTTSSYHTLISQVPLARYFMNSFVVTSLTLVMVLAFGSMIAYAVLRMRAVPAAIVYGTFSLGMMIPTQVNMIPVYLEMDKLNMVNTLYGLIFVESAFLMPVVVFIVGGFMRTLGKELMEAARMDGANEWQMFWRIALPLSTPAIASAAIFAGVIVWNDLLFPLLLIKTNNLRTLPIALLSFSGQYETNYPVIFSGVLLASIPMVVLFIFLQKYFVAGMTAGAVKG